MAAERVGWLIAYVGAEADENRVAEVRVGGAVYRLRQADTLLLDQSIDHIAVVLTAPDGG